MKYSRQIILSILLFGSIWGGLETVVTASMEGVGETISRSVVLAFVAILVLSYARMALPLRGTILAMGFVAAGFKFLGLPDLYNCQLAGVVGQALVLEIAFSLAEAGKRTSSFITMAVIIFVAAYANAALFCISQAYLFQNHWWADRGFGGLMQWIAVDGSQAALAGVLGFGLAILFVRSRALSYNRIVNLRAVPFYSIVFIVSVACWTVGAILIRM
jgi:hypothetical protein